jgi:hypothetical protein
MTKIETESFTEPEPNIVKQLDCLIVSDNEVNKSYPYVISLRRDRYNTYRFYVLCRSRILI